MPARSRLSSAANVRLPVSSLPFYLLRHAPQENGQLFVRPADMPDQPVDHGLVGLDYERDGRSFQSEITLQVVQVPDEAVMLLFVGTVFRVVVPYLQLFFHGKVGP